MSVPSKQGYLLAKRESSTRLRIRVRHPSAYKKRMRLAKKFLQIMLSDAKLTVEVRTSCATVNQEDNQEPWEC
jgi:hypothetical protein